MKKIILILSAAIAAISFASCNKENDAQSSEQKTITHTFTVSNQLWNGGDVKSAYTEGSGVALSGSEYMNVIYAVAGASTYSNYHLNASNKKTSDFPVATPDGSGSYTFTHNADISNPTATAYDYYFVMPYVITSRFSSTYTSMCVRLSQIQFPAANSFDPNQDFLVAKPVKNVTVDASAPSSSINSVTFKRLFAPLKVTINDPNNILNGEKIRMVSFVSSQTPLKTNCLIGVSYIAMSEDYAATKVSGVDQSSSGNSVTAVYPTGLAASAKSYSVWYMINPTTTNGGATTLSSGSTITVTITTDTKVVSKTITLASDMAFAADKINKMSVTIPSGTTVKKAYTWALNTLTAADGITSLTPTDGTVVTPWSQSSCDVFKDTNPSTLPNAFRINAATKKKPTVFSTLTLNLDDLETKVGKKITSLRFYIHPDSFSHTTDGTMKLTMSYTVGSTTMTQSQSGNYYFTTPSTGGIIEFTGLDSLTGNLNFTTDTQDYHIFLSAITAVCAD